MQDDPGLSALIERVRAARAAGTCLALTGHGSKAFHGGPIEGEPLATTGLAGISSYEPTELVVTARAGTPIAELEAALAEEGQCLAFEPPRFAIGADGTGASSATASTAAGGAGPSPRPASAAPRTGTVGGMVATGLSGPSRPYAGAVRDHVLGATLLNGRAEVLSFGGQVIKNVAGYDVSRLLCGSMGILGVILEVSLKVLPSQPATATLRFEMDEPTALAQLQTWGGQPLPLAGSAWWDGILVLRLRGARAAVDAAVARLGGERVDDALADSFWEGLRDHHDEFFAKAYRAVAAGSAVALWRLSLPPAAPAVSLPGEQLIEWGGAQRWWCTAASTNRVRDLAASVGGHAVRFHGGDRSAGSFAPLSSPLARIHRELKREFDPDGLFNPGRLIPDC